MIGIFLADVTTAANKPGGSIFTSVISALLLFTFKNSTVYEKLHFWFLKNIAEICTKYYTDYRENCQKTTVEMYAAQCVLEQIHKFVFT